MILDSHLKDKRREICITASEVYDTIHNRKQRWRIKTWREKPFAGNEATRYGTFFEKYALSSYERFINEICQTGNKFIVHPDLPFGASPDGYRQGNPIEIKCPFSQVIYETIPDRYLMQMQFQMFCTQTQKCHFVCWTPHSIATHDVEYDPKFIEWYAPLGLELLEYVRLDKEPPRWHKKPTWDFDKIKLVEKELV